MGTDSSRLRPRQALAAKLMPRTCHAVIRRLSVCIGLVAAGAAGQHPTAHLQTPWRALFAGEEAELHVHAGTRGTLSWQLTSRNRTLDSGEAAVTPGTTTPIRLRVPPLKPGVAMAADLTLREDAGTDQPASADSTVRFWLFSREPFAGQRRWLESLKLHVLDPDETAIPLFEAADIPFEQVQRFSQLPAVESGILLVAPGVSPHDYRGSVTTIYEAAARGVSVLWLSPGDGHLTMPSPDAPHLPRPRDLRLRGNDVVHSLDRRLDANGWPPDGRLATASWTLAPRRVDVVAQRRTDSRGWPWIELTFTGGGRAVFCQFPIVEKWETGGPTPRYLFAAILKYLSTDREETP